MQLRTYKGLLRRNATRSFLMCTCVCVCACMHCMQIKEKKWADVTVMPALAGCCTLLTLLSLSSIISWFFFSFLFRPVEVTSPWECMGGGIEWLELWIPFQSFSSTDSQAWIYMANENTYFLSSGNSSVGHFTPSLAKERKWLEPHISKSGEFLLILLW